MRIVLVSILLVLTGCAHLTPEDRERQQEDRQYHWQEACIEFLQVTKACNALGGHMVTSVHIPRHRVCPKHVIDMRMATCEK